MTAIVVFALINGALFYVALYRSVIAPDSSTGTFERSVAALRGWKADRRRDVLVLGDSRIFAGLDPRVADKAASGLRFLNAGIPGTTPRTWYFFDRAVDAHADRFRAVVIPVDTYSDDTSAIGSLDADDHALDLRYIVFAVTLRDVVPLATSFDEPSLQRNVAADLLLRGPILRNDVQSLLSNPAARISALATRSGAVDPQAAHPLPSSLAGLRVDFARERIVRYPPATSSYERAELVKQILPRPVLSDSYARYRKRWLGAIVSRYRASGIPVIFVRIPARPIHRREPRPLSGSLAMLAIPGGVSLIPQRAYVAMERPTLFADHDHLNPQGSRHFSTMLGRDVARILGQPAPWRSTFRSQGSTARPFRVDAQRKSSDAVRDLLVAAGIGIPIFFQTWEFALFFACVCVVFYAVPRRARPAVLLVASYYFYVRWNAWYVALLVCLTASDFVVGRALTTVPVRYRKLLLTAGVGANVGFLATFKYLNFAGATLAALSGRHGNPWYVSVIVPVGISFHTFQSISYLVDVARGRVKPVTRFLDYALYIAFFPQLLAGPIVRAARFFDELFAWQPPTIDEVERGLREIVLGLVKKLVIADQFAQVADPYFSSIGAHPGLAAAWSAAFAFAMQIYFDFAGYADIAIGCARLLGFRFPENFRRPYLAASVTEFWRRWNISLSTWLRDYLYIPLGGNRGTSFATRRNLVLTMLLAGLWHGADWTFVAWGGYHGLLLAVERALGIGRVASPHLFGRVVRTGVTFVLVLLGWVLFRARTFGGAYLVLKAMVAGGPGFLPIAAWTLVPVAVALAIGIAQEAGATWNWRTRPVIVQAGALACMLVAIELCSWPGPATPFVYFKF